MIIQCFKVFEKSVKSWISCMEFSKKNPALKQPTRMFHTLFVPPGDVRDHRFECWFFSWLHGALFLIFTPYQITTSGQHECEITGGKGATFVLTYFHCVNTAHIFICTSIDSSFQSHFFVDLTRFTFSSHRCICAITYKSTIQNSVSIDFRREQTW